MNKAIPIYREAKKLLISQAKEVTRTTDGRDKPYIRQVINDSADDIRRQLDFHRLRERISDKQYAQFCNWIDQLACNLHPRTK